VRCALTAVVERFAATPDLQNDAGILNPGFCGHQPEFPEYYLQDSAAYYFSACFQILALSPGSAFWSRPSTPWTSLKLWSGGTAPADHALGHFLKGKVHPSRID
jgi:hypothetical protein